MEESTQGVVEGAKLSDAAGQALAEIGEVSQNLAELIENISKRPRQQADSATGVAEQDAGYFARYRANDRRYAEDGDCGRRTCWPGDRTEGFGGRLQGRVTGTETRRHCPT